MRLFRNPLAVAALAGYLSTIVLANWLIDRFGLVPVGFGLMAPAGVYAAGLSFSLRDAVQERAGRDTALLAILIGGALSALIDPRLGLASAAAFAVSELADLAVYTPLRRRSSLVAVLLSNTVGAMVDSAIFLWLAFGSLAFMQGQVFGKVLMTLPVIVAISLWRVWRSWQQPALA